MSSGASAKPGGRLIDRPGTFSRSLRDRRFARFISHLEGLSSPRIVDLGGTLNFWRDRAALGPVAEGEVTLVNLQDQSGGPANVRWVEGDVASLKEFGDMEFDAVFSNSVIEHVGGLERQRAMAGEVRRLAPIYSLQTPNYWFPLEPHFMVPGWQWLPAGARIRILQKVPLGHRRVKAADPEEARRRVESVRLLTATELASLLPDGTLVPERLGPLVKSWTVERGRG